MNQKTIYFCSLLLKKLVNLKKENRVFEEGWNCALEKENDPSIHSGPSELTLIAKLVISQMQKNLNADADNPTLDIIFYHRGENFPDASYPSEVDELINVATEFIKIFVAKENK